MTQWLINRWLLAQGDAESGLSRERYGWLSGIVGIVTNVLLAGVKLIAGAWSGSVAITADGFNNLADVGSSVVTLVGFHLSGKEPDEDHPFGHGRVEYLSGLMVAVAIIVVGVEILKSSINKLLAPEPVVVTGWMIVVLVGSILGKLWLWYFNRKVNEKAKSTAIKAAAVDSLVDAQATGGVLLGITVGYFLERPIDGYMGILVSCAILKAGWDTIRTAIDPLLGQPPEPELVAAIEAFVMNYPEITGVHDLVVHDYGPGRCMCSIHAEVPMDAELMVIHEVIDHAERELKKHFHMEAVIHMDPIATNDPQVLATRHLMTELLVEIDPRLSIHDFRMTAGEQRKNLIFDVVVPSNLNLTDKQLKEMVEEKVNQWDETYGVIMSIDRAYSSGS